MKRLSQGDIDAGESLAHRRGHRSFERDAVCFKRIHQRFGNRRAMFLERLGTGEMRFPLRIDAGCFDDRQRGLGDFRTDAIARNQCYLVFHRSRLSREWRASLPRVDFVARSRLV